MIEEFRQQMRYRTVLPRDKYKVLTLSIWEIHSQYEHTNTKNLYRKVYTPSHEGIGPKYWGFTR